MIKKSILTAWCCIILFSTLATAQEPDIYLPRQMHADLNKFKNALEYAHPGVYTHNTRVELNNFFNQLIAQTSSPLNAVQFHNIVLQLIAYLHDGHTRVFATNKLRSYINRQKLLPFHSLILNQRIFITRNLSGKDIADGSEIIAINGISSDKIIATLQQHFAGDGFCTSCLEYRFGSSYNSFYRIFPLVFGFNTAYLLTLKDYKSNNITSIEVPALSGDEFRANEKLKYGNNLHTVSIEEAMAEPAFQINFSKDNEYAIMKISRFVKDGFEEPANTFPDLYANAFKQIKDKAIKNLIIDIRGNGGGIDGNAAHLVRYLVTRPFIPTLELSLKGNDKYYEKITKDSLHLDGYFGLQRASKGSYFVTNKENLVELKEFEPAKEYYFNGPVFVLIDGGSLSAAGAAAGLLREYTHAVFIGQQTGGYGGMSNGIRQLSIPGDSTHVSINIPLIHGEFGIHEQLRKRGITPDYWIENSIHDILVGRDVILEFALQKLRTLKSN